MNENEKVTIQAPTIGRVVVFTAWRGEGEASGKVDEYPGTIVKVHADGVVDIVTFGPNSVYHNNGVPYGANGQAGTWRYPLFCGDKIEVLP
jgi:hypothetical protein